MKKIKNNWSLDKFLVASTVLLLVLPAWTFTVIEGDYLAQTRNKSIEVCWVNGDSPFTPALRKEVRSFIESQINGRTSLKLLGWRHCESLSSPKKPVGILIYDDAIFDGQTLLQKQRHEWLKESGSNAMDPYAKTPGHPRMLHTLLTSEKYLVDVIITSRFMETLPSPVPLDQLYSPRGIKNLQLSVALHEFVHVLGAVHENLHPDSTCDVPEEVDHDGLFDPKPLTNYDPVSSMNRCHYRKFNYSMGVVPLSMGDVSGIENLYRTVK